MLRKNASGVIFRLNGRECWYAKYDSVASYTPINMLKALKHPLNVLLVVILDVLRFLFLIFRSDMELRAENFFLRKQLVFYAERKIRARQLINSLSMTSLRFAKKFWFTKRRNEACTIRKLTVDG